MYLSSVYSTFIQEESVSEKWREFQQYPFPIGQSESSMVIKTSLDIQKLSKFPRITGSRRVSIYPVQEPILEEAVVERDTESKEGT